MSSRSRLGGGGEYSVREEQKQLINNLLDMIYSNYEASTRLQNKMDSIYRMIMFLVICFVVLIVAASMAGCYYGCRRRDYSSHSLPQSSPDASVSQTRPRYHALFYLTADTNLSDSAKRRKSSPCFIKRNEESLLPYINLEKVLPLNYDRSLQSSLVIISRKERLSIQFV
ncbi:hypothetical protein PRIPAC_91675 [Pristionchus pacificus]|uniref:Uncharacterized protein n=1 Tax=Pristionchus pacificus TaxID=54126 RepID=A0A2A6BQV8_PRIPA|nr:hypothetical protein PRIPAC_91675 [Pristionchus pacificus]|eukprot:PDM68304.1 hypothetical protein PRIPAC_46348 [Pristionchus pacificus]